MAELTERQGAELKVWLRYTVGLVAGVLVGGAGAWLVTDRGMSNEAIRVGPWQTALNYGLASSDLLTRASVARSGLLALPASETVYWHTRTDSEGQPLRGDCTYAVRGGNIDARWWSITSYDKAGFLVANPARIWSFSGAALAEGERNGWLLTISARQPPTGHWLPAKPGQAYELTLRMYNPGPGLARAPTRARLPAIQQKGCP